MKCSYVCNIYSCNALIAPLKQFACKYIVKYMLFIDSNIFQISDSFLSILWLWHNHHNRCNVLLLFYLSISKPWSISIREYHFVVYYFLFLHPRFIGKINEKIKKVINFMFLLYIKSGIVLFNLNLINK